MPARDAVAKLKASVATNTLIGFEVVPTASIAAQSALPVTATPIAARTYGIGCLHARCKKSPSIATVVTAEAITAERITPRMDRNIRNK